VAHRRVRRARNLGIDYKVYAGICAATCRDIVALIFSSSALRLLRETAKVDAERAEKIRKTIDMQSFALMHLHHHPATVKKLIRPFCAPRLRRSDPDMGRNTRVYL
jgi:hypothetical protein